MIWLYWALRRRAEQKRKTAAAMREMRKYGYQSQWHNDTNKRRNWNQYAAK